MAFNKKKKRKIIVDEKVYYWTATGNDGWITLWIMTKLDGASKLNCQFDYHKIGGIDVNQFVITPAVVRQTIIYALSIGWKPFEKGKDLFLGHLDDKIDLKLLSEKYSD